MNLLDPYRFFVANPFDVTGKWGLFSLQKRMPGYAGPCMRIRNAANAELDIDFLAGVVDTASALTHAGGGDAWLVKWYDQFGLSNYVKQTTAGAQPRVVASGVWDGFVRFDGTDDFLVSDTTSGGANVATTAFMKATLRAVASTYIMLEHTVDTNANDGFDWYFYLFGGTAEATGWAIARNASADVIGATVVLNNFDGGVACLRCDMSEATVGNRGKSYLDGVFQDNSDVAAGDPTGAFADANYYVCSRAGSALFAPVNITDIVIYQGAAGLADPSIAAISTALA